ncbi:MAG: hydroxymethylglutaryl-CoA reductase, degradative [Anaerolineales bacterium]|nr:hydroxymethylglutaryl-CoA reductase, degradative [Anaerolineales bacterium]
MKTSRLSGFYKLAMEERRQLAAQSAGVMPEETAPFLPANGLSAVEADHMIENAVGIYSLPLGIALNFLINDREVLVPMAIEEPSVVAGASFMAKLARAGGGFKAKVSEPHMIGQIQVLDLTDLRRAKEILIEHKQEILSIADQADPVLKKLGGGSRDLEINIIEESKIGAFLVVHLIYDVRDAMGANAVNTACEKLAPQIESLTGGRVHLRILSNLADRRIASVSTRIPVGTLAFGDYPGEKVRDGIIEAYAFAEIDPYRAATHNKGIMNGVDAVVIATGNDWRAIEAGAHAYAVRSGRYTSLSTWTANSDGDLVGALEIPMAVGIIGGATKVHPTARAALHLMGVTSASQLAEIIVSVGLAQNLAALRALATEGIQRGHMSLHARQVAVAAGASGDMIGKLATQLVIDKVIRVDHAVEILKSWQQKK